MNPADTAALPNPPPVGGLPVVPGYEVLELVGRGGMGKVYRARDLALGRVVAVKLLLHDPDEKLLARFRDEARAVARLSHPNIAQVYESGVADGRPFYAQEFLAGGSLADRSAGKPQPPAEAAALVETVARAIHYSHDRGILHRDLKPANVLLADDGTPKVTDFGLAKALPAAAGDTKPESGGGVTRTGEIVGTPAYMPPEQASGVVSGVGPPADIYALGAVLYELLTGRPPFQAPDALQTILMVLGMDPVPPRTLQPKVPTDLETICLKCLEKDPKRRYATAADLADDLRRFLDDKPIVARPVGPVERAVKWARRRKAAAALVGVSAVLLAVVAGSAVALGVGYFRLDRSLKETEGANTALAQKNADLEDANARLAKSQGETEAMLGYALGTLDEYHFRLSEKLKDLPQGQKLRVEVLDQARKTLDDLYRANPRRPMVWEYLMAGFDLLGNAQGSVGDLDAARASHERAREAAARLAKDHPDNPVYRANNAMSALKIANTLSQQGREAEAGPLYAEAEREAAGQLDRHPDHLSVLKLNYLAHQRPMLRALAGNDPAAVEAGYRRYADLARRLAAAEPDNPAHPVAAIDWDLRRATYLAIHNKLDQAEAIVGPLKAALDRLPDPAAPAARGVRAVYHGTVATVADNRGKPADAEAAYRAALAEYESLAKDYPDNPGYRRSAATTWWAIGTVRRFSGRPDDARAAYRTAREAAERLARDYPANAQIKQLLDQIKNSENDLAAPPPGKTP